MNRLFLVVYAVIGLLIIRQGDLFAQSRTQNDSVKTAAPVIVGNDTLLFVYSKLGPFTNEDRAKAITERLHNSIENFTKTDSINIIKGDKSSDILFNDIVLMTVTDEDAQAAGKNRDELTSQNAEILLKKITQVSESSSLLKLFLNVLFIVLGLLLFIGLMKLFKKIFPKLYEKIKTSEGKNIKAFKIQTLEIFSSDQITAALIRATKYFRYLLTTLLVYIFVLFVFSLFPLTKEIGSSLFNYLLKPVKLFTDAIISFLPNLFSIIVISVAAYIVIKFFRMIARALENDKIRIPGFYKDWAIPTYKILRFIIIAFSAVMIFPYVPGSDSTAFQGLSVFLGVVLSFGSSSSISNVVAGIILTYTRSFDTGDRIKIGETVGDVLEKTLLVVRIRTIKNVDIAVPNSVVLGSHIINYSRSALEHGLILHTNVTIGYDVPWRTVHELLLNAAAKTNHLLKEPKPFVHQQSLDDFYVNYELNVYTNDSHSIASVYSELHQNIQDSFNEGGVEIMSPHYAALRDGNQVTIPENYLPKEYQTPGFRLFNYSLRNSKG